jgi:hypothetical protein
VAHILECRENFILIHRDECPVCLAHGLKDLFAPLGLCNGNAFARVGVVMMSMGSLLPAWNAAARGAQPAAWIAMSLGMVSMMPRLYSSE